MQIVDRVEVHEVILVIWLLGSILKYLMLLLLWQPLLQLERIVSRSNNHLPVIILDTIQTVVRPEQLHLVQLDFGLQLFNQLC